MTIRVNAFGKTIAFPAGTSLEDIEKHISSNRSLLDPEYKAPETGMLGKAAQFGKEFAQNSLGVDMGIDTSKQPTGQDYLKGFASGANKLVSGIGYLAEVAGAKDTGRSIREFGDRGAAYWNNLMSPAGLKAASDQVFEEVGENDGSLEFDFGDEPTEIFEDDRTSLFGLRLSRNWANALLMGAAQSAPSMFAAAVPGAITTSAIQKLASLGLAGGSGATIPLLAGTAAPVGVASNIIARTPAAIGFGTWEGITAGSMNAADLKSSIEGMPIEELRKSPVFAVLESEHGEDTARSLIAEQAASDVFGRTAVSTGAIGALTGGGALGQAYQKATGAAKGGMFNQAVKGTTQEALQEAPQSGMEKLIENVAVRDYLNPDQKIMEGVLADAASGAAIGGLMGGVVGGAGAVNVSASRAAKINEERTKLGLNKIASSGSVDEAINAAAETVSQKPVTPKDIWDDQAARDDLLMRAEQINQQKGVQNEAQVQGTETPAAEADVLSAKQAETLLNQAVANDESNSIPSPAQLDKDASGSDIIAQNLGNAAKGAATEIILPDNTTLPAEWMVVDADNVKATMKNGINQPRDRTRAAADVQIQQIANQPDYRRMSDSPVMDIGAPTLDSSGAIVGGNGRFEGVSRGYDAGTSAAYRAALEADAVKKGIDPATFAGMKKPVLVRRVTQPFDTQKLAVASNSGGSLEYSALERAKIDAERIGDIDQIEVTDSGDIALTKDNAANIRNALKGYSASELGSFVDNEGNLSQEGSRRLKNAILYSAYGNSKTLSRMVESTDTDMRNIVGALTKTAGQAARVRKNISQGGLPKSLDITDNLIEAVEKIGQIRSSGDTVDNYLSQGELFSDIALSEETKEIMTGLSDVMRSQKRMVEFLRATYNLIEKVDVTTDNVFGEPDIPSKLEVVKHAKQQTAEQRPASLFGEEAGTESAAKINNITSAEAGAKYSRSPEERLKDRERSRKLERALRQQGYNFTITPKDVRDFAALDRGRENEAIAAERIARIFRKRITWIEAKGDFGVNGITLPSIQDTIFIDVDTDKYAHAVMGHELSHHMEHDAPEVYSAMVEALTKIIPSTSEYAKKYGIKGADDAYIIKEIVGDIMGDNFTQPEFWNKVAAYNPNAFRKISDTIISWIKRLVTNAKARGLGSEQWVTDAQKAQDIVAKAVSQYTYTESSFDGLKNKPVFQKAWHGSPHDHDKFDASKIGTGEGAQAYGHGLYFTDTKEVAEYYKRVVSKDGGWDVDNSPMVRQLSKESLDRIKDTATFGNIVAVYFNQGPDAAKQSAMRAFDVSRGTKFSDAFHELAYEIDYEQQQGKLYQVELAPEPDEYLLWDKPLSQQSEKVRKALFEIRKSHPKDSVFSQSLQPFENSAGDSLYRALSRDSRNAAEASKIMHSAGIRGIKYLDGSSRRTGEGSYNYVIFDDKDVEITAKFSKQGELDLDPPTNKTKPKDDLQLESQNLKGNTKSKNPSGVIGELNYDNIQQRPGTTEKQREAGRNAYRQLLERIVSRGRGRLLGSSIAKNFREGKGASLVGQKVESSEDLAVLAQILRDPRFETFRIFYVKDGTVVHHTGVSSRIPASSRIFKVSDSPEKFYESIKANMQNLGADGYYLLHNHPSGKAEPSGADIGLTEGIEMNAPGFISHVIIDHNEYGEITIKRKGISKQTISDVKYRDMPGNETYQSILPHKLLGSKVSGPLDIVSMGKQLQLPDGYFTVIGLDAQLKVSSLSEFPTSVLKNPDIYLFGILRRYARNSGADAVVIVTNNTEYNVDIRSKLVYSGLRNNILLDVIDANTGVSYAEQSGYGGRGIFNKGKAYERVHEVNESGEKYDNGKESIPDTITIDGKERPTRNSNGKLIHPTEEGIRNFWRWFSPSPRQLLDGLSVSEISGLERDTEALSDFIEGQSRLSESNRFTVIPSSVFVHVAGAVSNDKILDAVVRSLPVDVMDFFARKKLSAEQVLHDATMFEDVFSINPASDVTLAVNPSMIAELAVRVVANAGAKITGLANGALKRNSAVLADANDPVLGAHVRKSSSGDLGIIAGFGESKVVDDQGNPLVVHHGSDADFNVFRTSSQMGAHLGNQSQAEYMGKNKREFYAKLSNPLRLKDAGGFDPYDVAQQLPGMIDQAKVIDLMDADKESEAAAHVQDVLQKNGFDGIVYLNRREGLNKQDFKNVAKISLDETNAMSDKDFKKSAPSANDSYIIFNPNQIKSATDNAGQFSPESDDIRFSRSSKWNGFPDTIIARRSVSDHPDYRAAKDGDFTAATRLAEETLTDEYLNQIKIAVDGREPIVAPVRSAEREGFANAIPEAVGMQIADRLGYSFDENGIRQRERVGRSGADGWHRIANQPTFEGKIEKGKDYIIVDDTLTQGGTIAQLKGYIDQEGGNVILATTLTGKQYSATISLSPLTLEILRAKHGKLEPWFRQSFGYGFEGLTESEARFIINAKGLSTEQVRERIAAAKRDGTDSNVQEDETEDSLKFSRSDTLSQAGVNTEESAKPSGLPEETKTQAFRRRSQDAMLRFKVVQNWLKEQGVSLSEAANVYQRENISKAKTANRIEDFRREQLEPLIKRIAETSKKATGEGKFDLADIATYLEAVHIPEANERMRTIHKDDKATANGITDDQARKVVKQFESMPNFAEFKKLADDVRKIGIDTLDMRLEAGLISQDQYDAYKSTYKNWVPLRGNIAKQGFGKGMSTNAKDKRRMGHGFREEEFVIENLVQDRERAIMQIEKNKIGMTVAQFLMEAENPNIGTIDKPEKMRVMKDFSYAVTFKGRAVGSFETEAGAKSAIDRIMGRKGDLLPEGESFTQTDFSIAKSYDPHIVMMARPQLAENEIQVYVNGHAVRLQLNDTGLARAATNAGIEQVGAIAHGARMFNRFLSKAYTAWSPDFLFMNMARDAYSGTLVLTGKKGAAFAAKTFTNYGTAVRELIKGRNDPKQSEWVSRYRAAGGNIGAAYLSDIERVGEDALAALQEFSGARETYRMVYNEQISKGSGPAKARTMAALKAGVAKTKSAPVVGHMFKTLERVNMVIENALRLATFKTAVESGESDQQAAMLSKDLMNFNRKGEIANQMGALYLFYNPGMQGAHIVGEALFTSKHRKQVWALLGALTTLSFILAEFARGGEDDEDREWENTPDYIKDRNLIFQFGDKQITVPVAYGFGIFHAMGNYLSDLNHGADKSEIAVKLASGMFENFSVFGNPIVGDDGDTEIRMDQVLPTLPKLIMAPGINMDSLGRQIHPTKYQDSVPDSQLMWRSVRGTAYEDMAHFMNDITGGSQYNPGAIDISPNTIKYWVTALTGGAGRFVSDITTGGLNAAEGIAPEIENVPVLRKFVREPGVSDSRGAFHKARKEAQSASERFNKALKNGDVFLSQQMLDENHEIIALANYAKQANKMASEARDAIMQIQLDKDMSKAEKKVRIKEIELQERKVYDMFLEIFDKAKKK